MQRASIVLERHEQYECDSGSTINEKGEYYDNRNNWWWFSKVKLKKNSISEEIHYK